VVYRRESEKRSTVDATVSRFAPTGFRPAPEVPQNTGFTRIN
jgi:hypothetical protein